MLAARVCTGAACLLAVLPMAFLLCRIEGRRQVVVESGTEA